MTTSNPIPGKDFPFFLWKVETLTRDLPDGDVYPESCVCSAVWSCTFYDQGKSVQLAGDVQFSAPDPNNYTPYTSITQAQALEWVKAIIGDEGVTLVEEELKRAMNEKLNPPTKIGAPWAGT